MTSKRRKELAKKRMEGSVQKLTDAFAKKNKKTPPCEVMSRYEWEMSCGGWDDVRRRRQTVISSPHSKTLPLSPGSPDFSYYMRVIRVGATPPPESGNTSTPAVRGRRA